MSIAREIVGFAMKAGSSDIHLEEGSPIAVRVNSDIKISPQTLGKEEMNNLLLELLGAEKNREFNETGDLDTSIGLEGLSRLRINAYVANEKRCLTLRLLPNDLPNWQDLGLPDSFINLSKLHRGLVLCTGPTGSGKSTSLAAFINCMLDTQRRHILTIEDPIEFIFNHTANSIIHQREVKRDTNSFSTALRAALREDPDVIYIGEMRDLETIQLAITAAETGHLVLGTLHTSSASQTIDRMIDVFPPQQQQQVRVQLSSSLIGVISQTLCKTRDKQRKLAAEILINNTAISNLIRESKSSQIYSQIQVGAKFGMQTLEQSLFDLFDKGLINKEEAFSKSNRQSVLQSIIENNDNN